jgi:hypothetical protein
LLHTTLRIALSRGLGALREAQPSAGNADSSRAPASLVDELSRLATLLNDGLLTKEEFDLLKAKLVGRSFGNPRSQQPQTPDDV